MVHESFLHSIFDDADAYIDAESSIRGLTGRLALLSERDDGSLNQLDNHGNAPLADVDYIWEDA